MAFEELEVTRGPSKDRSRWHISISNKGAILVWVPKETTLFASPGCVCSRGTGLDACWLLIKPAAKGIKNWRALNATPRDLFKVIRFSTLPFAPRGKTPTKEVEVQSVEGGAFKVRLPWMGSDGRPLSPPQALAERQASGEHLYPQTQSLPATNPRVDPTSHRGMSSPYNSPKTPERR